MDGAVYGGVDVCVRRATLPRASAPARRRRGLSEWRAFTQFVGLECGWRDALS